MARLVFIVLLIYTITCSCIVLERKQVAFLVDKTYSMIAYCELVKSTMVSISMRLGQNQEDTFLQTFPFDIDDYNHYGGNFARGNIENSTHSNYDCRSLLSSSHCEEDVLNYLYTFLKFLPSQGISERYLFIFTDASPYTSDALLKRIIGQITGSHPIKLIFFVFAECLDSNNGAYHVLAKLSDGFMFSLHYPENYVKQLNHITNNINTFLEPCPRETCIPQLHLTHNKKESMLVLRVDEFMDSYVLIMNGTFTIETVGYRRFLNLTVFKLEEIKERVTVHFHTGPSYFKAYVRSATVENTFKISYSINMWENNLELKDLEFTSWNNDRIFPIQNVRVYEDLIQTKKKTLFPLAPNRFSFEVKSFYTLHVQVQVNNVSVTRTVFPSVFQKYPESDGSFQYIYGLEGNTMTLACSVPDSFAFNSVNGSKVKIANNYTVQAISKHDEGTYTCGDGNKYQFDSRHIYVKEIPLWIQIESEQGLRVMVLQNTEYSLTCYKSSANVKIIWEFYSDFHEKYNWISDDANNHYANNDPKRYGDTLKFFKLDLYNHSGTYQCTGKKGFALKTAEVKFRVMNDINITEVHANDEQLETVNDAIILYDNGDKRNYILQCFATGNPKPKTFIRFRDQKQNTNYTLKLQSYADFEHETLALLCTAERPPLQAREKKFKLQIWPKLTAKWKIPNSRTCLHATESPPFECFDPYNKTIKYGNYKCHDDIEKTNNLPICPEPIWGDWSHCPALALVNVALATRKNTACGKNCIDEFDTQTHLCKNECIQSQYSYSEDKTFCSSKGFKIKRFQKKSGNTFCGHLAYAAGEFSDCGGKTPTGYINLNGRYHDIDECEHIDYELKNHKFIKPKLRLLIRCENYEGGYVIKCSGKYNYSGIKNICGECDNGFAKYCNYTYPVITQDVRQNCYCVSGRQSKR